MDTTIAIEIPPASSASIPAGNVTLRTNVVRRARVSARLNRALRAPLTVLAAPAGFGKTTALQIWLEDSPLPYAWLSLDEDDDAVETFLRHLIAAVQTHRPEFGRTALAALAGMAAPSISTLATTLVSEFADLPGEFILVLDDYHVIRDPSVHECMRRVVTRLPDSIHLLVASRSVPPWPLARLRALDRLVAIGAADLGFTPPEATALLEMTAGRALDAAIASVALARAEGWPLGLRLIGVALRDHPDAVDVVSPLHGDNNRDLLQYFLEEVLARQSATVQASMLASSIFDRFTPALCGAVVGDDPAWSDCVTIDWPEQTDLFLSALDDEPGWYRRHPMCREALHYALLKRHGPAAVATLHRRASDWFAHRGMMDEAIRHALAAGETRAAAQLVERHAVNLILVERWLDLEAWLDLLPGEAEARSPWLIACRSWTLWQRQDFARMPALLKQAEMLIPQLGSAPDSVPVATVQAAVHTLWAAMYAFLGMPEQALDRASRAREAVGDAEHPLYPWVIFFEGVTLQFAGQQERALAVLTGALANGAGHVRPLLTVYALRGLAFVHYLSGRLSDVEMVAARLLELHEAAGQVIGESWAHYWLGMVYYEWNRRDLARHHFGWLIARRDLTNHVILRDSVLAVAMLEHIDDRAAETEALLATLKALALSTENYDTLQQLDEFRALLALAGGESAEAEQRLALASAPGERGILAFLPAPQLIRARVLLAHGDVEAAARALAAVTELQRVAESRGHHRRLIETLTVRALAHERLNQPAEAAKHLTRALMLAEPGGFTRTFVDLGPELALLLGVLARHGVAARYIGRLLGDFAASPAHRSAAAEAAARREHAQAQLVEPLTERELAVVRLLGQRLSYAEIATELTIAPSTVKTHVNHIYGKLGASGRKDAIVTADRLGLMTASST
jgi:LuxR family maltose regulon positive regulatory protein